MVVLLSVLFSYWFNLLYLHLLFSEEFANGNQNEVCVGCILFIFKKFTEVYVLNVLALEDLRRVNHIMLVYKQISYHLDGRGHDFLNFIFILKHLSDNHKEVFPVSLGHVRFILPLDLFIEELEEVLFSLNIKSAFALFAPDLLYGADESRSFRDIANTNTSMSLLYDDLAVLRQLFILFRHICGNSVLLTFIPLYII